MEIDVKVVTSKTIMILILFTREFRVQCTFSYSPMLPIVLSYSATFYNVKTAFAIWSNVLANFAILTNF